MAIPMMRPVSKKRVDAAIQVMSEIMEEYWAKKIEAHDELIGLRSGRPIHPEALDKHIAAWDKMYVDNCESAVTLCEQFEPDGIPNNGKEPTNAT